MKSVSLNVLSDLAKEFISGFKGDIVDPVTFVEEGWGLNIKLRPVQKFLLRALYGLPLDNTNRCIPIPDLLNEKTLFTFTEQEFLHWLYQEGRCNTDSTEGRIFQELVLVAGRRFSKSTMAAFISNYEFYRLIKRGDPSEYYRMTPQTVIAVLNVGPTEEEADVVFEKIQSMATRCVFFQGRILHPTMNYFDLLTDADMEVQGKKRASLLALSGGCSANSILGRAAIVVIMDEMATFIDTNGRFSGAEVYNNLTPSIADFGQDGKGIFLSSPYGRFGKFYDLYQKSFENSNSTLMFKMYSTMGNPELFPAFLRAERKKSRVNFMCQYGGEFSDLITAWIDDAEELKKCITLPYLPSKGIFDVKYFLGVDLGFKNDGAAIAIVHKDIMTGKIILDFADVWFSGSSDVWEHENSIYRQCNKYAHLELLRMADITREIKALNRWFPIKNGIFDQSNGFAFAEVLVFEKLAQIEMEHFTDTKNMEIFELTKRLYSEGLIVLNDHPVLVPEMLSLEAEKRNKGKIIVRAPNRDGAHDDISTAYVRAVYCCYKFTEGGVYNITTGAGGMSRGAGMQNRRFPIKRETQGEFIIKRMKQHGEVAANFYGKEKNLR